VDSITPYATWDNSYGQPQYPVYCWPTAGQPTKYHHPSPPSWDSSLESTNVQQLRAVPHDYWGASQTRHPTNTFYAVGGVQLSSRNPVDVFTQEDVCAFHRPSTGLVTAGMTSMGQFQPYGTSSTYLNGLGNAEAGSSILASLSAPRIPQPSGRGSETTADAENQTSTEGHRATVSNFYYSHIPRVTEWSLGVRSPSGPDSPVARGKYAPAACGCGGTATSCVTGSSSGGSSRKLRASTWLLQVSAYPILNDASGLIDCTAAAVEIVTTIRPQRYLEHRLRNGRGVRTAKGSRSANNEFERRNVERRLYQKLSQHYPLGWKQELWARPALLLKGKLDAITRHTDDISLT